jgi:hypothetical protein
MSDYDKHLIRLGDRYPLALSVRDTVPGTHIWTQDQLLPYHATGVNMFVGPFPKQSDLTGYDYWVASPEDPVPGWLDQTPVFSSGAFRLYRVPRPTK